MFSNVPKDLHMAKIVLRLPTVKQRTGLGRSTIYSRIALGKFPRPIRLGERCVGWLENDIEAWLDERIEEARGETD